MYRIEVRSSAARELEKLDGSIRKRIVADIEKLADNPRPAGVKKLSGEDDLYRIRVGPGKNYRVVYQIKDDMLLVVLVKVGDRKDVYRGL